MAKKMKKKKSGKKKETTKKKRPTCIAFLRELYSNNLNIANEKALEKLLAKFPESNATVKAITTWKKMLRDEGIDIPKRKAGSKKQDAKKTKKVKKKKKS